VTAVIFTGPTLAPKDARAILEADYRPPATRGDVYRAALGAPTAIGIIDGCFEHMPSVWHKEILWAMARGVHVFGAASMGALRAAELASYGMHGVGHVFEAFRDGRLEDDDEVAIEYGPPEAHHLWTEAMVNMRVTFEAAAGADIIVHDTAASLIAIAKSLFFKERSYPRVLRHAADQGLPPDELSALQDWLPSGRIDQKESDARAMLSVMKSFLATDPKPKAIPYTFNHTTKWASLVKTCANAGVQARR